MKKDILNLLIKFQLKMMKIIIILNVLIMNQNLQIIISIQKKNLLKFVMNHVLHVIMVEMEMSIIVHHAKKVI